MATKTKELPGTEQIAAAAAQAVARFLQSEVPLKLKGKGDTIFPTVSGVQKLAMERCINGEPAWLIVRKEGKVEVVSVTADGFTAAVPFLNSDTLGSAAAKFAPSIASATARITFLEDIVHATPAAVVELQPLLDAALVEQRQEREREEAAQIARRAKEQAILEAMERWKASQVLQKDERISALKRALAAEGVTISDGVTGPGETPKGPTEKIPPPIGPKISVSDPITDGDYAYRRDVARQLAGSWQATWQPDRPEIRDFLESAMWNVHGFQMIGAEGDTVTFEGRLHEGEAGLFTGDKAQVVRPGWVLNEGEDAEHVVLKAFVSPMR